MKLWIGPEMEGNSDRNVTTLFVKTPFVYGKTLIRCLNEYPCNRIYLGAGRTDVIGLQPDSSKEEFLEFVDYCRERKIMIVLEVGIENICKVPEVVWESADQIITRILNRELGMLNSDDCIKIDTEERVYMMDIQGMWHTDLANLGNDLFKSDKLLYSDEEDEIECE